MIRWMILSATILTIINIVRRGFGHFEVGGGDHEIFFNTVEDVISTTSSSLPSMTTTTEWIQQPSSSSSSSSSSHCQFRDFPQETHLKVPHLFDAFADNTKEWAIFVGAHRKETMPGSQYMESDSLFMSDPEMGQRQHHFICRFQGTISVLSEAVHPPGIGGGHPFAS